MTNFSRSNPSPRYTELLGYYREMHVNGARDQNIPAAQTFSGGSLGSHVNDLQGIISVLGSKTILDYGSGKGTLYGAKKLNVPGRGEFAGIRDYWNVDQITCFDPGFEPFSNLPEDMFDGVVCTDVLEHCPKEDIPWVLDEIFGYASEFVYLCIACYPAQKTLPNGENAHCTIEGPDWWLSLLNERVKHTPGLRYFATLELPGTDDMGNPGIEPKKFHGKWNMN